MTIKGSKPPIQLAARLWGSVAALFQFFTGKSSAKKQFVAQLLEQAVVIVR